MLGIPEQMAADASLKNAITTWICAASVLNLGVASAEVKLDGTGDKRVATTREGVGGTLDIDAMRPAQLPS